MTPRSNVLYDANSHEGASPHLFHSMTDGRVADCRNVSAESPHGQSRIVSARSSTRPLWSGWVPRGPIIVTDIAAGTAGALLTPAGGRIRPRCDVTSALHKMASRTVQTQVIPQRWKISALRSEVVGLRVVFRMLHLNYVCVSYPLNISHLMR